MVDPTHMEHCIVGYPGFLLPANDYFLHDIQGPDEIKTACDGHGSGLRSADPEEHGVSLPTAKEGTSTIPFCCETIVRATLPTVLPVS